MSISLGDKQRKTLAEWTEIMCVQDMPIFSSTAQSIYQTLGNDFKGAEELSHVIMQDPKLMAQLLKISDSPFYNRSGQTMNTIVRAIVIMGASAIRELTIACSFFDAVLSPENKDYANQLIGDSIHAAVQAKEISIYFKVKSPESIFIATLLNRIGAIAFWCFAGEESNAINELLKNPNITREQAEQEVLGFSLTELSASLSKVWCLGGLIDAAINTPDADDPEVQLVKLGNEVVEAICYDWDSEEFKECVKNIESLTGRSGAIISRRLRTNTEDAVLVARQFGAYEAAECIKRSPSRVKEYRLQLKVQEESVVKQQIQSIVAQEIETLLEGNFNINQLFDKILEGIHYGVGMDRTLFALLSTDKKLLNEKISLGWNKDHASTKVHFHVTQNPANLFYVAMQQTNGLWAKPATHAGLFNLHVINVIGKRECFLFPIYNENKPIGLIYADRVTNPQPFVEEDFNLAKNFAQLGMQGLTLFRGKKT